MTASWAERAPAERALVLYRFARAVREETRSLARLVANERGLPVTVGRLFDAGAAAESLLYYAGWADKLAYAFPGRTVRAAGAAGIAAEGPLPLARLAMLVGPALACGNRVVLVPPRALAAAERFVELGLRAGLGEETLRIEARIEDVGSFASRADLDVVAYRGPGSQAEAFARAARARADIVADGKTSHIVLADASLDAAAEAILSPVALAGGDGGAGARVFVAEAAGDDLVRRLRARLGRLRSGDPLDATTDVGPVSPAERAHLQALLDDATSLGAMIVQSASAAGDDDLPFPPTILTEAVPAHRVVNEPFCGPLVPVVTFRTPDEAIARANHVPGHASATVWSSQGAAALAIARALDARCVWVGTGYRAEHLPAHHALRAFLA